MYEDDLEKVPRRLRRFYREREPAAMSPKAREELRKKDMERGRKAEEARRKEMEKQKKAEEKIRKREEERKKLEGKIQRKREKEKGKEEAKQAGKKKEKRGGFFSFLSRKKGKKAETDSDKARKEAEKIYEKIRKLQTEEKKYEQKPAKEIPVQHMHEEEIRKMAADLAMERLKEFKGTHQRFPSGTEYEEMANSIYEQIKYGYITQPKGEAAKPEEKTEKKAPKEEEKAKEKMKRLSPRERIALRRRMRLQPQKAEKMEEAIAEGKKAEEKPAELLGAAAPQEPAKEPPSPIDLLKEEDELAGVGETKGAAGDIGELGELKFGEDVEGKKEKEMGKCANCGQETEKQIFCPKCGASFCKNCASKVEELTDSTSYVCPKCGNNFKVAKR